MCNFGTGPMGHGSQPCSQVQTSGTCSSQRRGLNKKVLLIRIVSADWSRAKFF